MMLPRLPIGTIFPCLFLALVSIPAAPAHPAASLPLYPGLEMTATLDKRVYKVGEPVVLRVNIKNASIHTIEIGSGESERTSFDFLVRDKHGKTLPLTPYGRMLQNNHAVASRLQKHHTVCRSVLTKLAAGRILPLHFDLSRRFVLQTPGNYSVVLSRWVFKENDRSAAHGWHQVVTQRLFFTVQGTH